MPDNISALYGALKKNDFQVPENEDDFRKAIQNPKIVNELHSALKQNDFQVPESVNDFSSWLNPTQQEVKKKEETPFTSGGAYVRPLSQGGGEPAQSIYEPSQTATTQVGFTKGGIRGKSDAQIMAERRADAIANVRREQEKANASGQYYGTDIVGITKPKEEAKGTAFGRNLDLYNKERVEEGKLVESVGATQTIPTSITKAAPPREIKVKKETSILDDINTSAKQTIDNIVNSWEQGQIQGKEANVLNINELVGKGLSDQQIADIAKLESQKKKIGQTFAMDEWNKAQGIKESVNAFLKNPVDVAIGLALPSISALVRHGASRVAAGTAVGATAGSVVPAAGTLAGAGLGATAGMITSGLNLEYANSILESLNEAGIDISNEKSLRNGFSDENKMSEARKYALKRGVPIAIIDIVTGGLAGKLTNIPAKNIVKKAAKTAAELGIQVGGGAGGEALAQLSSKGYIDSKEVLGEAFGEFGGGVGEIAIGATTYNKPKEKAITPPMEGEAQPPAKSGTPPTMPVGEAITAVKEEVVTPQGKVAPTSVQLSPESQAKIDEVKSERAKILAGLDTDNNGQVIMTQEAQTKLADLKNQELKIQEDDSQNKQRVSSEVGIGQKPIEAQPVGEGGKEAIAPSGVFQTPTQEVIIPDTPAGHVTAVMDNPTADNVQNLADNAVSLAQEVIKQGNDQGTIPQEKMPTLEETTPVAEAPKIEMPKVEAPISEATAKALEGLNPSTRKETPQAGSVGVGGDVEATAKAITEKLSKQKDDLIQSIYDKYKGEEASKKIKELFASKEYKDIEEQINQLNPVGADLIGFEKTLSESDAKDYAKYREIGYRIVAADKENGYKPFKVSEAEKKQYVELKKKFDSKFADYKKQVDTENIKTKSKAVEQSLKEAPQAGSVVGGEVESRNIKSVDEYVEPNEEDIKDGNTFELIRGNVYDSKGGVGQAKNIQGIGLGDAMPSIFGDVLMQRSIKESESIILKSTDRLKVVEAEIERLGNKDDRTTKEFQELEKLFVEKNSLRNQLKTQTKRVADYNKEKSEQDKIDKENADLGLVWLTNQKETARSYAEQLSKVQKAIIGERGDPKPNYDVVKVTPKKIFDLTKLTDENGSLYENGAKLEEIENLLGIKLESLPGNPEYAYQLFRDRNAKKVVELLKEKGYDVVRLKEGNQDNFILLNKGKAVEQSLKEPQAGSVGVGGDVEATAKALEDVERNTEDLSTALDVAEGRLKSTDLTKSEQRDRLIPIIKDLLKQDNYIGQSFSGQTAKSKAKAISKGLSEAYHKAKADDSNPELVKAVEQSLKETPQAETIEDKKAKAGESLRNLLGKTGVIKNIVPSEDSDTWNDIKNIADYIAAETGKKGKELIEAIKKYLKTNGGEAIIPQIETYEKRIIAESSQEGVETTEPTNIRIFEELDAINEKRIEKKIDFRDSISFNKKYGDKAQLAKDITNNFEKYIDKLLKEGIIVKVKC